MIGFVIIVPTFEVHPHIIQPLYQKICLCQIAFHSTYQHPEAPTLKLLHFQLYQPCHELPFSFLLRS